MFTENQLRILTALISRPEKEYHMSELGEILGKHPGVFQRGLESLERQGYVTSRKRRNQRLFKIKTKHPLFSEIRNIVQKTYGIEGRLQRVSSNAESRQSIAVCTRPFVREPIFRQNVCRGMLPFSHLQTGAPLLQKQVGQVSQA